MAKPGGNDIGEFSRRLSVMRNTPTRGLDGAVLSGWAVAFKVWAKDPVFSDPVRVDKNDSDGAGISLKFEVRRISAQHILTTDRIFDYGETYIITDNIAISTEVSVIYCTRET